MPAAFSSGRVSSKMRPFERARVIIAPPRGAANDGSRGGSFDSFDVRADAAQLRFHLVVAAVQVVDAVDDRIAVGDEYGDNQAGGRTPDGSHCHHAWWGLVAVSDGRTH